MPARETFPAAPPRRGRVGALLALLLATAAGTGCTLMTDPRLAQEAQRPKFQPARNVTGFSASLRCMDDLFLRFGRTNYFVTSQGVPDETGEAKAGTKEMLISAISAMSVRSNAFTFVDYDQAQGDIEFLQKASSPNGGLPADFAIPTFYIRGAVTQVDSGVIADSASGAISAPAADLGLSKDQVVSVVAVDLNVGNVQTRQIYPGVGSTNSIAVRRSGKAVDAGGTIKGFGVNFNLSYNKSEGLSQAVRTLIELGAVEVTGKLLQVPYWRCLQIEQTNPEAVSLSREWFAKMGEADRVRFAQRALRGLGRYEGEVTGTADEATREALGSYQAEHGLVADGRVNYELYASLIGGDLALGREPPVGGPPSAPYRPSATPPEPAITLTTSTYKGPYHRYNAGEPLTVTLRSTADAFAYCYYRDAAGRTARIFPNRFQPDPLVEANRVVTVPGPGAAFELVPERPGSAEEVLCLATRREAGPPAPATLQGPDLSPLAVASLDQVEAGFGLAGQKPAATSRLKIQVLP